VNLLKRVVTGGALIAVTAWLLFLQNPVFFSIEATLFIALALYEFFELLLKSGVPVSKYFGIGMGAVIPLVIYMEFGSTRSGEVLFLVIGCLFLFVFKFFRKPDPQALFGISLTLFGLLYISWFLSFTIKLRFLPGGAMWVAYLISVTKAADIGAYSIGTLFGRHPLVPHISPKKSVEGLFGGLFLSVAISIAFMKYLPVSFSLIHMAVMGLIIGGVGQTGDLSESMMKRFCRTKDSGGLFPGFGGVLDTVDSIQFTAPLFYFHLLAYLQ
jgi:phosphatidate cytidylyltransferase